MYLPSDSPSTSSSSFVNHPKTHWGKKKTLKQKCVNSWSYYIRKERRLKGIDEDSNDRKKRLV